MRFLCALCAAMWVSASAFAADAVSFRGVVTLMRDVDDYFFAHAEDGRDWRVSMDGKPKQRFARGDLVEVSGELERPENRHANRLFGADVKKTGHDAASVPAPRRTTITALHEKTADAVLPEPNWYGNFVEVEGVVHDFWRKDGLLTIVLDDHGKYTCALVSTRIEAPMPEYFNNGAVVRIVGVALYSAMWGENHALIGFTSVNVLAQGMDAVTVLSRPPWWTPAKIWMLLGLVVAVAAFVVWRVRAEKRARLREAEAVQRERLRLSHDLHDGFQQLLAACDFRIGAAVNSFGGDKAEALDHLQKARDAIAHMQRGLRSVLWALTEESDGPGTVEGLFTAAAERLAHWEGVVHFAFEGEETEASGRFRGHLLMILQEAVQNALTHGSAARVDVKVVFRPEGLVMRVKDDGIGFDAGAAEKSGHLGLMTMRSRVRDMGGRMHIRSSIGEGTTLVFAIPFRKE